MSLFDNYKDLLAAIGKKVDLLVNQLADKASASDLAAVRKIANTVQSNLKNYYNKSQVNSLVNRIPKFKTQIIDHEPYEWETLEENVIYLYKNKDSGINMYTEYMYINGRVEKLGDAKIDFEVFKEFGVATDPRSSSGNYYWYYNNKSYLFNQKQYCIVEIPKDYNSSDYYYSVDYTGSTIPTMKFEIPYYHYYKKGDMVFGCLKGYEYYNGVQFPVYELTTQLPGGGGGSGIEYLMGTSYSGNNIYSSTHSSFKKIEVGTPILVKNPYAAGQTGQITYVESNVGNFLFDTMDYKGGVIIYRCYSISGNTYYFSPMTNFSGSYEIQQDSNGYYIEV